MRTAKDIIQAPAAHQLELKAKYHLTNQMFQSMLAMLDELTPAERKTLEHPDFITEDEADLIVSDRQTDEQAYGLLSVIAEMGYTPRAKVHDFLRSWVIHAPR